MLFLLLCIALLILIVAVFYFIRLKKSMDVTQFIDLLYKDDEEK